MLEIATKTRTETEEAAALTWRDVVAEETIVWRALTTRTADGDTVVAADVMKQLIGQRMMTSDAD